jgi:hypothetical protein
MEEGEVGMLVKREWAGKNVQLFPRGGYDILRPVGMRVPLYISNIKPDYGIEAG